MYCRNCGKEADDNAAFCGSCGKPLHPEGEAAERAVAAKQNPPSESAKPRPAHSPNETRPKNRSMKLLIALAVALVALLAVLGVGFHLRAAANPDMPLHAIYFKVNAPGYTEADSPFPVQVTGQTAAGESYDAMQFVYANENRFDVPQGDYTLTITASPLSHAGSLYDVSGQEYQLAVTEESERKITIETDPMAWIDPADVTDEQIEAAYHYANESDFATTEDLRARLEQSRADAIDDRLESEEQARAEAETQAQKEAEEEARRLAEEQAQLEAEAATNRDSLTGTFWALGAGAPNALESATLSDTEMTLTGELNQMDEGSMGSKTWVFAVDENTQYGYAIYDGFHEQPKDEFAQAFENLQFPGISLEIQDGVVTRAWTSA